jgi:hypothetical protein
MIRPVANTHWAGKTLLRLRQVGRRVCRRRSCTRSCGNCRVALFPSLRAVPESFRNPRWRIRVDARARSGGRRRLRGRGMVLEQSGRHPPRQEHQRYGNRPARGHTLGSLAGATLLTIWSIRHRASRRTPVETSLYRRPRRSLLALRSEASPAEFVYGRKRCEYGSYPTRLLAVNRDRYPSRPVTKSSVNGYAAGSQTSIVTPVHRNRDSARSPRNRSG